VKTFEELTEQLQESPAKVASQMLAVKSLFRGLMKSLEEVGDE
jgi:hypothetical protein